MKIRLLYDDVGCWRVDSMFMTRCCVKASKCKAFKGPFPRFTSKVNYRNHRKIAIIDGRIGFIGGMNIAERYIKGFSWGIWRDTHVRMEGKGVYGLQSAFLTDWFAIDRTLLTSAEYFPKMKDNGSA